MRRIAIAIVIISGGCSEAETRQPHWEVDVAVGVTEKINPEETITSGVTLKRLVDASKAASGRD